MNEENLKKYEELEEEIKVNDEKLIKLEEEVVSVLNSFKSIKDKLKLKQAEKDFLQERKLRLEAEKKLLEKSINE